MAIHTGLDWSEDPATGWVVLAMVHVDTDDLGELKSRFVEARVSLGRSEAFVFKHLEADDRTHDVFYRELRLVPSVSVDVLRLNRQTWEPRSPRPSRGDHVICSGIIELLAACPDDLTQDQMLLIDLPRSEKGIVDAFRTIIRKELRQSRRAGLRDVRPRPDHRPDGAIIQAADMIAGEVRQFNGLGGPYLPRLGGRIRFV
ncbi:MAG: hypothetical protein R2853_13155 [Thermomicrobiales bacterium]